MLTRAMQAAVKDESERWLTAVLPLCMQRAISRQAAGKFFLFETNHL